MAALSAERSTKQKAIEVIPMRYSLPVAGSTTIYAGGIVCINSSGYAVPGSTSTTLTAIGCAQETVVNGGANGAKTITVHAGVYCYNNSSAGDLITIADVGKDVYIVDDQTVAKTNGTSTRSVAGKVYSVDTFGVAVIIGIR